MVFEKLKEIFGRVIGLCADERVKVDCNTAKILTIKLPSEDLFNE